MKTNTQTLAAALRILANDIESPDGVANAAIAEATEWLDELMAQVDFWRDIAEECATIGTKVEACHRFEAALKVSPTQCLREIQAEAVQKFANEACGNCESDFQRQLSVVADQYANRIRKGEKP
jgi:hypothetical protein